MFTTRPELKGDFGMVASTHWLASAAGMSVLERGGNAFDAAAAAGLLLQVVEPHLNGPGGEVPIILYSTKRDEVFVVDGQGVAPAAASIEHYRDLGLDLVPGTGPLAACVPGALGAWMLMLGEFGTMRPADVLAHAIDYAEHGYPVLPGIEAAVRSVEDMFRTEWTDSASVYLDGISPPRTGSRWRNPVLAQTYRRIVDESKAAGTDRDSQIEGARRAFYEGFVAEAIDDYVAHNEIMDTSGRRNRGLLSGADMATWRAGVEAPVSADYAGLTVCKTGPWGQGPVFLQQLALLEGFDLESMPQGGADFIHTMREARVCRSGSVVRRPEIRRRPPRRAPRRALHREPPRVGVRRCLARAEAGARRRPDAPASRFRARGRGGGLRGSRRAHDGEGSARRYLSRRRR